MANNHCYVGCLAARLQESHSGQSSSACKHGEDQGTEGYGPIGNGGLQGHGHEGREVEGQEEEYRPTVLPQEQDCITGLVLVSPGMGMGMTVCVCQAGVIRFMEATNHID